jgi:hypothetical protein
MLKPPPMSPQQGSSAHLAPIPTVAQVDGRRAHGPSNRWARRAIAVGVPALAALALAMPRGPITTLDGLTTMSVAVIVGLVAGFALRSRWAMLLAPPTFVAAFELVRLGADGPTVDAIHTSTYGLMAFAVGRGIHGALALLPNGPGRRARRRHRPTQHRGSTGPPRPGASGAVRPPRGRCPRRGRTGRPGGGDRPPGEYRSDPRSRRRPPRGQHRRADPRADRRPRPCHDDPRRQQQGPGAAVPRRRSRRH